MNKSIYIILFVYNLLIRAIRVLDKISSKKVEILSIQILWRFLLILGMYPDFSICNNCRTEVKLEDDLFLSLYSGALCVKCIKNQSGNLCMLLDIFCEQYLGSLMFLICFYKFYLCSSFYK